MEGEEQIKNYISSTYDEVTKWKKNLFMMPRGKSGTDFIKELTRLLYVFIDDTKWSKVTLALIHIYIPLMLQKPSSKSNAKFLIARLQKWNCGENREVQKRLTQRTAKKKEIKEKAFCRLMLVGKVSQAMKFINNDDLTLGVHPINSIIKELLQEKHPKGREALNEILLPESAPDPLPIIYKEIDADKVYKAALNIQGSGGPSLMDADGWRHMLCSKAYGNASTNLFQGIADLAKQLWL